MTATQYKSPWHIDNPEDLADEIDKAMGKFMEENTDRSEETQARALSIIEDITRKYYAKTTKKKGTAAS